MNDPTLPVKARKKLIEVALPLEAINEEGAHRKRKAPAGYPTTLHKWWAQRPVAAARAVTFAQLVDDPSTYVDTLLHIPETRRRSEREHQKRHDLWKLRTIAFEKSTGTESIAVPEPGPEPTLEDCAADLERQRLFRIIERLILWENTNNTDVLEEARAEIWQSWRRACADNAGHPLASTLFDRYKLPPFHDPFSGSGAIPLEAQRLGLEVHANDLNPVAVAICKGMVEIPPKFIGMAPINPMVREEAKHGELRAWKRTEGLAADLRYYGKLINDAAEKHLALLYPLIEITPEMVSERPDLLEFVGHRLRPIAWLWARTVKSPNPAFSDVDVPLASTFVLSTKAGKEYFVQPVVAGRSFDFCVKTGNSHLYTAAKAGTKLGRGSNFKCIMSGSVISGDYVKSEGIAGRLGTRLMAIVVDGRRGRTYLSPTKEQEEAAYAAVAGWQPEGLVPARLTGGTCVPYGLRSWADLFTKRQLAALNTFADLIRDLHDQVEQQAAAIRVEKPTGELKNSQIFAKSYADAISLYMTFALSRCADYGSSLATWRSKDNAMRSSMPKQAIQMSWDFAEGAPFGQSSSGFLECVNVVAKVLETSLGCGPQGFAEQKGAQMSLADLGTSRIFSTDPPYYDNVGYADLSDFLYVWLRRCLREIFPSQFSTMATPKEEELVATAYRHGGKDAAEKFFLNGMTDAMHRLAESTHPTFPVTIYYAYKQSEVKDDVTESRTGWETFLDAVVRAGFAISGTWPVRTESDNRQVGIGANALASSIVLVCRPRALSAPTATRRDFLNALKAELPEALRQLQRGNIAPVDLAQAAIGPGMAVFTRYQKVIGAEGSILGVKDALLLINEVLDDVLAEQEGDFDAESRFAIAWFEQFGFDEGEFGIADVLARAKVTSVAGLAEAKVVISKGGKVRLLRPNELPHEWTPFDDKRLTVWESVHHMIRVLEVGGEGAAAELLAQLGVVAEPARELAYRLYTVSEKKRRASEALAYNALVQSWPEISRLSQAHADISKQFGQPDMFGGA